MIESDTYLATREEGAIAEARKIVLRLGRKRFGEPDETTRTTLEVLSDLERLERLGEQMFEAANWLELLQMP